MSVTTIKAKPIELAWVEKGDRRFLVFRFQGNFSSAVCEATVECWRKEFKTRVRATEKVSIIWNCLEMSDYDTSARKLWQEALSEMSGNIDQIWLVTTNPMFRMAAKTMGLLTRYSIKTASTEEEIEWKATL